MWVGKPIVYKLYAVIVHPGNHSKCGHYTCFVKPSSINWWLIDYTALLTNFCLSDVLREKKI